MNSRQMWKIVCISTLFLGVVLSVHFMPKSAMAASEEDIDKMTTYAVILGRSIACGIDTDFAMRRVGAWVDRTFPLGSSDQKSYLPVFVIGLEYHAKQQSSGKSPDTCTQIKRTFNGMQWS